VRGSGEPQESSICNTLTSENLQSIETAVVLDEVEGSYGWMRARIGGHFFNDGSSSGPGDQTGEIWAEMGIGLFDGFLGAQFSLARSLDPDGANYEVLVDGLLAPVGVGTPYILSISWVPEEAYFLFTLKNADGTTITQAKYDVHMAVNDPVSPDFCMGTRVSVSGSNWGLARARFDWVNVNGLLYDDFGGAQLDNTFKWASWALDTAREIRDGRAYLRTRNNSGEASDMALQFPNPAEIEVIEATGILRHVVSNGQGWVRLGAGGIYYQDGAGSDIYAEVALGDRPDDGTDALKAYGVLWDLGSGERIAVADIMSGLSLDTEYHMSITYDGADTFTFAVSGTSVTLAGPPRAAPAANPFKAIRTRISPEMAAAQGEVIAEVDDVYINEMPAADDRLSFFEVVVSEGNLQADFGVLPDFHDSLASAVLTGPQGFYYPFDLNDDLWIWPTECRPLQFWIAGFGPFFEYGPYTLTLQFADGAVATFTKDLQEAMVFPVDAGTMDAQQNADGSMDFYWTPPLPGQYYNLKIRSADGRIEYYRSPTLTTATHLHVPAEDLRCLEGGEEYRWFIRAYDLDPVTIEGVAQHNAYENSEPLFFTYIAVEPPSEPPPGRYTLTVQVFLDFNCRSFYTAGLDRPLYDVPVTLTFANGATVTRNTNMRGWAYFTGFDPTDGVVVNVALPESYRGYPIDVCRNCYAQYVLYPEDFGSFRSRYIQYRAWFALGD
jgi:hypothetical protein